MTPSDNLERLTMDDLEWATDLLTDAFLDETPTTHLFRGPKRLAQTRYFMRCTAAYSLLFGEAYATPDRSGVALWLLPDATTMTFGRMRKAGMLSAPFRMGLSGFGRFMNFADHTDKMHRRAAPMPHYYLFTLGVSRSAQGKGVGRRLVTEMLERIDAESTPAYLETQNERNVPLYQRLGFDVVAREPFAKLNGVENFAMLRRAGASRES